MNVSLISAMRLWGEGVRRCWLSAGLGAGLSDALGGVLVEAMAIGNGGNGPRRVLDRDSAASASSRAVISASSRCFSDMCVDSPPGPSTRSSVRASSGIAVDGPAPSASGT